MRGFYLSTVNKWGGGKDRCGGLINPVLCSSYIQVGGWSAAPISGVSHCRPKLLQVANLITLCHCPCVRRQQVFVLFVLVRPKYCAPISGALPAGGAVGCEVLVRGQGVDCKLLTLCHPAPAQRFAFVLSANLACP